MKHKKIIIFGTPTIGKSYLTKNSKYSCWDSDLFYNLISSIEENHFNSLAIDIKKTKKIFELVIEKIIKSKYQILLFSILPLDLLNVFNCKEFSDFKIFFISRNPDDLMKKWAKRDGIKITKKHANSCYEFVVRQSKLINSTFIEIKDNEYLLDIVSKLI